MEMFYVTYPKLFRGVLFVSGQEGRLNCVVRDINRVEETHDKLTDLLGTHVHSIRVVPVIEPEGILQHTAGKSASLLEGLVAMWDLGSSPVSHRGPRTLTGA